jgi:2-keto-3-deoxy-6-phosphogluconate aldolase
LAHLFAALDQHDKSMLTADLGADFLVSLVYILSLTDAAAAENIQLLPGVAMLKLIAGLLSSVPFCPTGGVNISNDGDFLPWPNVLCIGGRWMRPIFAIKIARGLSRRLV